MHVSHVSEPYTPEAESSGMGRRALRGLARPASVAAGSHSGSRRDVLNAEKRRQITVPDTQLSKSALTARHEAGHLMWFTGSHHGAWRPLQYLPF